MDGATWPSSVLTSPMVTGRNKGPAREEGSRSLRDGPQLRLPPQTVLGSLLGGLSGRRAQSCAAVFTSPSNLSAPPFMSAGGETAGLRSPAAASAQTGRVSPGRRVWAESDWRRVQARRRRRSRCGKTEVTGLGRSGRASEGVRPPGGALTRFSLPARVRREKQL